MKTISVPWFMPMIAVTAMSFLVYFISQQVLRQSANDPQIQIAEDIVAALSSGKQAADFNISDKINIAKSLAPYSIIYDVNGKPLASTGELNGEIPKLPQGVFESAKSMGENRISWQPQQDVRSALVIVPYPGGYVAAGRSLREVEIRESNMLKLTGVFWGIAMVVMAILFLFRKKK